MSSRPTIELVELDLARIGGPGFAQDVQEALDQIAEAFNDDHSYGGDKHTATMTLKVKLTHDSETGAVQADANVQVALPKRRGRKTWARLRGGKLLVEAGQDDGRQLAVLDHDPATGTFKPSVVQRHGAGGTNQE